MSRHITPRRSRAVVAAALASGAVLLSACSQTPERPRAEGATAIVVGNRANMPAPGLSQLADEVLDDAVRSQDAISVVSVSGAPAVIGQLNTSSACDSRTACEPVWAGFLEQIRGAMGSTEARATVPEADTLGAIALAARQLQASDGPRQLVIVDNGLQTAGEMPLQDPGATSADPAAVAESLKQNLALPDLSGVDVLFSGLGSTHSPQKQLSESNKNKLQALWTAVLGAADPKSLTFDPSVPQDAPPADGLPEVSSVGFTPPPPPEPEEEPCIRLRADQVGFEPDKSTFRDPARANDVLRPIAEALRTDGGSAVLTGTTAEPERDPRSPERLSLRRAEAVQQALIELGVREDQVRELRGVGTDFEGFVPDTNAKGQLIETKAVQNRLVIIQVSGADCD